MKRILIPCCLIGVIACTPSIQTLSLEGRVSLPSFPEISSDGWQVSLCDLRGKQGASLGNTSGDHFASKLDKRFPSGLYMLSVRHPKKGTMFAVAFPLTERKDLVLSTASTLAAMGLMVGARIGDSTLQKIPPSRLEAMIPQDLKSRFERAYEDSLTSTGSVPADNMTLARDCYWDLRTQIERNPD